MKKVFVLLTLLSLTAASFAQQPSLPNGNFESWRLYTPANTPPYPPAYSPAYYEPNGGFFLTLNILDTIPTSCGVTVFRAKDTVHTGNYAARCRTAQMVIVPPVVTIIPGVVGTLKIDWLYSRAKLGVPYNWTTKAQRFQGWYQSYPVNGDSTGAILLLSKWNSGTHKRDTIAYNRIVWKTQVNTWTQFDQAINYWNSTTMPDSITLLLLSCAGYNASNMLGSVGQVGSQALFDDVNITNVAGVDYVFNPQVDVKITPNPASSFINIALDKEIRDAKFEVYSASGNQVAGSLISGKTARLDVSRLSSGVYYYRLSADGQSQNTGSFVVNK
jgi:hypothetical protein